MTKSTNTKRALLFSFVSLLLCCAMLVGSTFAWFTDSASTGVNKIVAGNLDIGLYQGTVSGTETKSITYSATEVDENTKLFLDNALWEPGHTEVAYLKIANNGNLALKYRLLITANNEVTATSATGAEIKLSEVLKFGVAEIDEDDFYASREDAIAAVAASAGNLASKTIDGTMTAQNETKYLALVVYMPTSVGNEANWNGEGDAPSIDLGITLVATQETSENDSIDNTYDANAVYLSIKNKDSIAQTLTTPSAATGKKVAGSHGATISQRDDGAIVATLPSTATVSYSTNAGSENDSYSGTTMGDAANWVGITVVAPSYADLKNATFLRPNGTVGYFDRVKDGVDYAMFWWGFSSTGAQSVTYLFDWDVDGIYDAAYVIDVSAATVEPAQ